MARKRRPPRPGALNEHSPLKIFTQIVIVQLVYYLSAFALIIFSALVAGKRFNLDLIFDWHSLRGDTTLGWMLGVIWVMNSFTGIILMLVLVRRSKLVLDFALTLHFIHFLTVSLYSHSLPQNITWWATQFISAGAIIFMGVWSCQWRELRPISFGADTGASRPSTALGNLINSCNKESEVGSRSRKSKIAEPAESFEMVGMMSNNLEMEP
ncbi:Protein SYS1 [Erysiphe neolycopersici]|uniref:Protein SYS1 n=1 Tax=Erysiphe neolycopersici TaxID=212602 RepID=A0A420I2A1_9PEZI|nr:Protein SYS1 [Erysiphe neolycopersici]